MAEPFIAEIRIFAGNFAPRGFAFCNGQLLPIAQNTALFSLVGTIYGGDGRVTFGLPNLQGRAPMHPGNGPGLTPRVLGQSIGSSVETLSEAQMPSHSHPLPVGSNAATSGMPASDSHLAVSDTRVYRAAIAPAPMGDVTGGGQAHNNMQPYLGLNFIIALQGIFPSRP